MKQLCLCISDESGPARAIVFTMKRITSLMGRIFLHRRLLATLAAMVCVLALCLLISGRGETTVEVYTSASRLPAGTTIQTNQIQLTAVPTDLVPSGAITAAADTSGQMTAVAIPAGAILTKDSFVALSQTADGDVIIPLTVSAEILAVLRPGDQVSVFLTTADADEVTVIKGIRIVTIPAADSAGPFSTAGSNDFVLVEVPEAAATSITQAASLGSITVALE